MYLAMSLLSLTPLGDLFEEATRQDRVWLQLSSWADGAELCCLTRSWAEETCSQCEWASPISAFPETGMERDQVAATCNEAGDRSKIVWFPSSHLYVEVCWGIRED